MKTLVTGALKKRASLIIHDENKCMYIRGTM